MALHLKPILFSSSRITLIIAFLVSLAPMLTVAQQCFTPIGVVLQGFGLCDPTNSTSSCCKINENNGNCVENGLCSTSYGFLYRGGCTDESFKSGFCPTNCINCKLRMNPKPSLAKKLSVISRLSEVLGVSMPGISKPIRIVLLRQWQQQRVLQWYRSCIYYRYRGDCGDFVDNCDWDKPKELWNTSCVL